MFQDHFLNFFSTSSFSLACGLAMHLHTVSFAPPPLVGLHRCPVHLGAHSTFPSNFSLSQGGQKRHMPNNHMSRLTRPRSRSPKMCSGPSPQRIQDVGAFFQLSVLEEVCAWRIIPVSKCLITMVSFRP